MLPDFEMLLWSNEWDALGLRQEGYDALDRKRKEAKRIEKSIAKLREKKATEKQKALEIYFRSSRITEKMPVHRIAKVLREELLSKYQEAPHPNTIKNWLREEGYI